MKFRDEYRDPAAARRFAEAISRSVTRPWTLMEVCGGQTHAIVRFGIDRLLPADVSLVHGPGCPVCVTPVEYIDKAIELASRPAVTLCSFGDMRVAGDVRRTTRLRTAPLQAYCRSTNRRGGTRTRTIPRQGKSAVCMFPRSI